MDTIIDVSAAFAYITEPKLKDHFKHIFEISNRLIAPDLFIAEATNAAWKYHKIESRPLNECKKLLIRAIALPEPFIPTLKFHEQALALSCEFQHPAYDCFYLALAQEYVGTLLTFDKKLIKLADQLGIPTITFN